MSQQDPTGTRFDGVTIASWIAPRLQFARESGLWKGRVVSGFRSEADQRRVGAAYAASLGKTVAQVYPHGVTASAHCGLLFPRGAVDVTDAGGLRAAMDKWEREGRKHPLIGGGRVLAFDVPHFSSNGH